MTNKRDWTKIKYYPVSLEKLQQASMKEAAILLLPMNIGEDYEHFDEVKHLLDIPEEPKDIEYYQKELKEKIDKLIENTKNKFYQSKYISEKIYETKFNWIIENFEYAKKYGYFPPKTLFTVGGGSTVNNYVSSNFVINSNSTGVGYWGIKPNVQMWLEKKPNWVVRKCAKIFFDFTWKDA